MINRQSMKNANYEIDKNHKIKSVHVLLLSALWLVVEFEIMILSNTDPSFILPPNLSAGTWLIGSNLDIEQVRMHLFIDQLICILISSNLKPPIKGWME